MKKKLKGKQRLPVIDSLVYSNLIFQIALGNNYAQKIYEDFKKVYKKPKSASVISRQLDILETEEHYLSSELNENKNVFPMQKLRIYSVNWDKIIAEFLDFLKEARDRFLKESERLQANIEETFGKERLSLLKILDNKEYIEKLKGNYYLREYFKIYFKKIAEVSRNYSIAQVFVFLLFFGDFDFLQSGSIGMNIARVQSFLEKDKSGNLPQSIIGMPKEEWNKIINNLDKKEHKERMKHFLEKNMDFKDSFYRVQERIKEIAEKDKDLGELVYFNKILSILKIEVTLQTSLNETNNLVGDLILEKHFTPEEKARLRQFDFNRMRPKTPEELKSETYPSNPEKPQEKDAK